MNLFRFIICVVAFCGATTFNSCQKDEIHKFNPELSKQNSGNLAFHAVDGSRREIQGVTISIASTEFNLHHETYVATQVTDVKGRADFGQLTQGEYFYKAEGFVHGARCYREGTVHVQANRDLIRDITLQ